MWKIICKTEAVNLNLMAITYSSLPHKKQQRIKKEKSKKEKKRHTGLSKVRYMTRARIRENQILRIKTEDFFFDKPRKNTIIIYFE